MTLDRRLARETAPFAAATLLGFAIVPIGGLLDWGGYALASALMIAVGLSIVLVPWRRLPPLLRVVPSLLFLVAVALLRDVSGVVAGVGALTLIPVFWVALHGSRGQLMVIVAGVCAFFVAPDLPAGDPEQHPISVWRIALVFGAACAIIGVAVQNLVARVRSHASALAVRERDLEAVGDLLRSLSLVTDARERICAGVCDLSEAHFAVLLEAKPDGGLEWTAGAGLSLSPLTFTSSDGPSAAMTAYSSGAALFLSDIGAPVAREIPELDGVAALDGADRPAALLFEPVHHGGTVAGVVVAGWREPPPDDERRARGLVRLLASEAAFVIERADLLGQLTEFALTDELTGLPNRRAWDKHLERAVREPEPLCVAILDLDRFKSYNDDHGHQAGDRLLKEAAAAWRAVLRPTDTLARYGGEEFVVLLREDDLQTARDVVDRLRAATPRGQSCSAGIARRKGDEAAGALLGRADQALYEAKRTGRDRSLIADAETRGSAWPA
ncbi:MAG TPA: sensor domain-containing diguanylate cyclase [Thermoleophilaceae bacterium]|nr:sensor domain-containing diguanylate cyclase [Thermoleophilaceae bacterium]